MTSDTVDFLMSQKDGANYVVLYQMLCLKTINTGGKLSRTIGEVVIPFDVDKIQRDCKWFSIDTIRIALELYKRFGLVYEDQNGTLVLAKFSEMVGSETDWAQQKRNQSLSKHNTLRITGGNDVESGVEKFHTDIRDKILDIRDKENRESDKDKRMLNKDVCAEASPAPAAPPVISMPCIKGEVYKVTQEAFENDKETYPAVDVLQEYKNMKRWLETNKTKLKTKRGMPRFINNWLAKEQDKGGKGADKNDHNRGNHSKPDEGPRTVYNLKPRFAGHKYDADGNDITNL